MNIKFKVNRTMYQLSSGSADVILNKVSKIKTGAKKGEETFIFQGYHKDVFSALKSIPNIEVLSSEVTTFKELAILLEGVMKRLNEVIDEFSLKDVKVE